MWEETHRYPPDVEAHLTFLRKMRDAMPEDDVVDAVEPREEKKTKRHKVSNLQLLLELIFASLILLLFL